MIAAFFCNKFKRVLAWTLFCSCGNDNDAGVGIILLFSDVNLHGRIVWQSMSKVKDLVLRRGPDLSPTMLISSAMPF